MLTITSAERRTLRVKAHHLHPVVAIGQHGLTPSVIREIDVNLRAHELIKVRAFSDIRGERDAMLGQLCAKLGAAPVQHIGKLLILWRPAPEEALVKEKDAREKGPGAKAATKSDWKTRTVQQRGKTGKTMAKSTPQARRPRSPTARAPMRPPSAGASSTRRGGPPGIPSAPVSRARRRRRTP
ncbi:MAG: YhbY family RNA-binding protein [Pseudomonadota bacterium]|nr:YhbY family RNA-binding protein [Pseudomonadota bacterium]